METFCSQWLTLQPEMQSLTNQSKQYESDMQTVVSTLDDYIAKTLTMGTVTSEQKSAINQAYSELVDLMRQKLTVDSDQIMQTFIRLSQNTAAQLGISVGEMTRIFEEFQNPFFRIHLQCAGKNFANTGPGSH